MIEDSRFATGTQVRNYSEAEKSEKPNIPGYQLMQLMDQLYGFLQLNNRCNVFVYGTGGTGLFIANSLQSCEAVRRLVVCVAHGKRTEKVLQTLAEFPKVISRMASKPSEGVDDRDRIDCWCILHPSQKNWWRYLQDQRLLPPGGRVLVFDPLREMKNVNGGKYFVTSQIWICDQ